MAVSSRVLIQSWYCESVQHPVNSHRIGKTLTDLPDKLDPVSPVGGRILLVIVKYSMREIVFLAITLDLYNATITLSNYG